MLKKQGTDRYFTERRSKYEGQNHRRMYWMRTLCRYLPERVLHRKGWPGGGLRTARWRR